MANILSIENLTKSYGDRLLFGDVTFGLEQGDKTGIVARNGTGKSTFLDILAGKESADSGTVTFRNDLRVGYLQQDSSFAPGLSIWQTALENNDDPRAQALSAHARALADGNDVAAEAALHSMDTLNAWDYEDRLRSTLGTLGLHDTDVQVDILSGGQRKRLALARLVMSDPDLLLLDEPTNHLDIATIEWLENYLRRSHATILMVTHDRYFLDRVCNRIIEFDNGTAYIVQGNFATYLRRRAERIEAEAADLARTRNTLRREQEWMSRQPQARAGKAKFRIDNFYTLKERASRPQQQGDIRLQTQASRLGNKIFEACHIDKRFGDNVILDDFTYTFAPGEKLGIVGVNGVGKSTLIKVLQGMMPVDGGTLELGQTLRFGYYSQDGINFDNDKKVIDAITELAEDIELKEGLHLSPMQYLQRFLFTPKDQQKFISTLSGGERCRLHLAVVLMRQPNFLILDEPTNDLDIVTLGIVEEYLCSFKGCVIIVSHDRYFLDNIVDHLFVMEGNGVIRDFPGNYSDYRTYLDTVANEPKPLKTSVSSKSDNNRAARPAKLTFRQKRELEELEADLNSLNDEKATLEQSFATGDAGDAATLARNTQRYAEIKELIDEKEMRWLELSEIE